MSTGRVCGSCDLCCKLPSIDWPEFPDLKKPPNVYCKHCIPGSGCGIHADRPMHCASFQCLWLMGLVPEELRPDRMGGFFDAVDAGKLLLIADPSRPDPRTIPAVAAFIAAWRKRRRMDLVVYREEGPRAGPGPATPPCKGDRGPKGRR